jgi:lysophospholipase L1-like esterase
MKTLKKIIERQKDNHNPPVTVAFLGDSVTQGCFEVYKKSETTIETVFDKSAAYHRYFEMIFDVLCPKAPVNIINAGVSGSNAKAGLQRLDEFVISHKPDLTVVCFGLNDCKNGIEGISTYVDSLSAIFDNLTSAGSEIIFMTPNMMCCTISPHITDAVTKEIAEMCMDNQNKGMLDAYIDAARALCKEKGIPVCDVYKKWKRMAECGIDVTELLANKINHPTREMNWLFAASLLETIFDEGI